MAENIAPSHHPRNDISIPIEEEEAGVGQSSSPSNFNTLLEPERRATDRTGRPIEISGMAENIASSHHPRGATDHTRRPKWILGMAEIIARLHTFSPSNSNNLTQPKALGNHCNNTRYPQTKSLEEDLLQLSKTSSDSKSWSIFKVPPQIRKANEKVYEPSVISIGPYHHGKEHLKKMEIIKRDCLSRIIEDSMDKAKELVKAMKDMEEYVRKCYAEAVDHIDSYAFVKMMILDGCFVVDLFQNKISGKHFPELNGIFADIYQDLLLLENQLPFSVLSKLYGMISHPNVEIDEFTRFAQMDAFARLALSCVSPDMPAVQGSRSVRFPEKFSGNINNLQNIQHLLGLVHDSLIPQPTRAQGPFSKFIRSARELEEAGIKFVKKDIEGGKDNNGKDEDGVGSLLFDIKFTDDAKLKIPALEVDDNTESILRNFMAYEQFIPMESPKYFCDYAVFLNNLIDSGKDVQLLRHSGIIVNLLGTDEAVAQMINRLGDNICLSQSTFSYEEIYDKVDKHCQRKWNKWKAKLRKDYFNSPWSLISVVAALVLLLLTVVQTIFSVLSYVHQ